MTDGDLKRLARSVLAGDLPAAGLLLDLLSEAQDPRYHALGLALGVLKSEADYILARSERRKAAGHWTPERAAYEVDESHQRAWRSFAKRFWELFWIELDALAPLDALAALGERLGAKKQAERFASAPDEDESQGF